jgi:hypothetical protein
MTAEPDILDEPFHAISLHTFIIQAREQRCWPESELTRRRAYALGAISTHLWG